MRRLHEIHQHIAADIDHYTKTALPPLHRHVLEENQQQPASEYEREVQRQRRRATMLAQVYRDEESQTDVVYCLALLIIQQGLGGIIVGNPIAILPDGRKQDLPYTGLEGYYAGTEQTAEHPGLLPGTILQEEADLGVAFLQSLKKEAIQHNAWADFAHLQHMLAGKTPDGETLHAAQLSWDIITSRLRVRIYHNPEFESTLTEQIEQVEHTLNDTPQRTGEEQRLHAKLEADYRQLRQQYQQMGKAGWAQERQERQRREDIRAKRISEWNHFHDIVLEAATTFAKKQEKTDSSILPKTLFSCETTVRDKYPATQVHFSESQLVGYLFLAHLGTTVLIYRVQEARDQEQNLQ